MPLEPSSSKFMLQPMVAAGGTVLSQLLAGIQNRKNLKMQNEYNRQMADYQYSKDLEMWNKTNEYNQPSSQMTRLKAAGLSPHLVYGSGGATTQSAQMPRYQAPSASFDRIPLVDLPSTIAQYQDVQIKAAQLDNLKYQGDILREEAANRGDMLLYKKTGIDFDTRMKAVKQSMMANDYSLNEQGLPTPWQRHQMEILSGKARTGNLAYDKMLQDIAKTKAATNYQNLMIQWYSGDKIMKMLGVAGGLFKGIGTRRGTPGRANPEGLNRAQSKKLEEFKRKFIKDYER